MAKFFYRILFGAETGRCAVGVLVFDTESMRIVGADSSEVAYEGRFEVTSDRLEAQILVSAPAGVTLITGIAPPAHASQWTERVSIPLDELTAPFKINTAYGCITATLNKIRMTD